MARVVADAGAAGLDGVLVTPGPDLVWLTGYQPTAITERLTMLVLTADREPTLLVPTLERPDAEAAEGHAGHHPGRLDGRRRPVRRRQPDAATGAGPTAISDSAWAMHLLGLQAAAPGLGVRLDDAEPADAAGGQGRTTSWPG